MPAEDIGLIVIDEEYDASYKQSEQTRYHARRVAECRARWHHCPLVLGAATPSMESYYRAENGEITTLLLPERIGGVSDDADDAFARTSNYFAFKPARLCHSCFL